MRDAALLLGVNPGICTALQHMLNARALDLVEGEGGQRVRGPLRSVSLETAALPIPRRINNRQMRCMGPTKCIIASALAVKGHEVLRHEV